MTDSVLVSRVIEHAQHSLRIGVRQSLAQLETDHIFSILPLQILQSERS